MSAELFYLVGKPNNLKQELVSQLKERLSEDKDIIIPQVVTTDPEVAEGDNYIHVEENDFRLRDSMGMYCLKWSKKGHFYGVVADVVQRLNTGVDIVINGSFHNLEQAKTQFPNLNTVIIKKQGVSSQSSSNQYLIAEEEDVKLEWNDKDGDMYHPYVLSMLSEDNVEKGIEILIGLFAYDRKSLAKVI